MFFSPFTCFVYLMVFFASLECTYIERFNTIANGGIIYTGNTLGLSKLVGQNEPGTSDSDGAFITTDTSSQVGSYLPGTTLTWQSNSSFAFLDLPSGSTVLYAELVWSGSYGFQNQITGNEPNTPITFIDPFGVTTTVTPDPATAQQAITPGYTASGNYTRSADVTSLVIAGGAGMYTVGGIAATISGLDDTHNAAGWTLAVAYSNPANLTNNLTIFVGCEQASNNTNLPATITGFCTPATGPVSGILFISAIEGDANKTGDHMLYGNSLPLTFGANSLSGVNNPINNFFASQINTIMAANGSAMLDTRGSFGSFNANAFTGIIMPGDRQGYDITSINISSQLVNNQTTAYALGTTTSDDYTINSVAMEIQVNAPFIQTTKLVNGVTSLNSEVGNTVTFTFTLQNTGTSDADNVVFIDQLETGLTFVPGSFMFNSVTQANPNLNTGFAVGSLAINQTATIQFQAHIQTYPTSGSVFLDTATVNYQYTTCLGALMNLTAISNTVSIQLPSQLIPNLVSTKLVNSSDTISAMVGNVVTFSFSITNTGSGDALNAVFIDHLQTGLSFVPGSFMVNMVPISPDPNLNTGYSLGDIMIGQTDQIMFQAMINTFPAAGGTYLNSATINYQYMPFINVYDDLTSTTNSVSITFNDPPYLFEGRVKKCKFLNKNSYRLIATFREAPSSSVLFYRIYLGNEIVATIPATDPLVFSTCLCSRGAALGYQVAAVYPNNVESPRIPIRIF